MKATVLRHLIKPLFRRSLGHPHKTLIFQNPDDRDRVSAMTKVSLQQVRLIRGGPCMHTGALFVR